MDVDAGTPGPSCSPAPSLSLGASAQLAGNPRFEKVRRSRGRAVSGQLCGPGIQRAGQRSTAARHAAHRNWFWQPHLALHRLPAHPLAQIRDLKRGAFGFVVLAHDRQCDDRVALKVSGCGCRAFMRRSSVMSLLRPAASPRSAGCLIGCIHALVFCMLVSFKPSCALCRFPCPSAPVCPVHRARSWGGCCAALHMLPRGSCCRHSHSLPLRRPVWRALPALGCAAAARPTSWCPPALLPLARRCLLAAQQPPLP